MEQNVLAYCKSSCSISMDIFLLNNISFLLHSVKTDISLSLELRQTSLFIVNSCLLIWS